MKFLIIRRADADTEAGIMPEDSLLMAMGKYNQEMADAGVFLDGTGLKPSDQGARVEFVDGYPTITDGPFAETKELIAGFSVIEVASKEEAISWAQKWPAQDAGGAAKLELRQLFEMEDFEQGEGIATHEQLGAQLARRPTSMSTYLTFNGDCAKAMHLYADVLGGHIDAMMAFDDTPAKDHVPTDWQEKIMHSQLSIGRWKLMGCDAPPGMYNPPQGLNVQMDVDSVENAERIFASLAEKGKVVMPIEKTFWAERFGALVDRFGIPWMINFQGDADI
ncbi:MAG: VOC family protein [Gammaproteobacteria bacterium]|jgi:PhnB protein|nr:VOC family protein [Gammaproteobacteria bacterium]MBQ0774373.1 VOC family protein [Gammaproteobacteria bacterium]